MKVKTIPHNPLSENRESIFCSRLISRYVLQTTVEYPFANASCSMD